MQNVIINILHDKKSIHRYKLSSNMSILIDIKITMIPSQTNKK